MDRKEDRQAHPLSLSRGATREGRAMVQPGRAWPELLTVTLIQGYPAGVAEGGRAFPEGQSSTGAGLRSQEWGCQ